MIFIEAFVNSLKLPNKKAMFRLNRIGMDIVVFYLFILIFIVSIPHLVDQLQATEGFAGELSFILKIIYFFMFYYLPLTIAVFVFLSIMAYVGIGISKLLKRKLRYQILWKLLAFTTTIPFLVYVILALFLPISDRYLFLAIIYSFILLIMMILNFPRRRVRKKQK
jgi:Na+-transporting methylmalonyl-CoA/oxaloacetate decarboxylase gamma subunit